MVGDFDFDSAAARRFWNSVFKTVVGREDDFVGNASAGTKLQKDCDAIELLCSARVHSSPLRSSGSQRQFGQLRSIDLNQDRRYRTATTFSALDISRQSRSRSSWMSLKAEEDRMSIFGKIMSGIFGTKAEAASP